MATIYQNPDCGTSRNALAWLRAAGYEPTIVEYLQPGWTEPQLRELITAIYVRARDPLREKGTPAAELRLLQPSVTEEEILRAMVQNPGLVNRPIVVTPKGAKLARPAEVVLQLLEKRPHSFTKGDGEIVED